jgi:pyruvate formate lyase activating enzyme
LLKLKGFISGLKFMDKIELLPYHKLATSKYENLGLDYKIKDINEPTKEQLKNISLMLQLV